MNRNSHTRRCIRLLVALALILGLGLTFTQAAYANGGTTYYVDPSGSDGNACTSTGTAACLTIQGAIGKAASGDTVNVGAGTYTEDLVIPEALSSLELVGAGSGSTTIKGVANMPVASWPTVAPNIEVLADGVAIHGFTIQGPDPASGYYSSGMVIGGANVEVYDNVFEVPNAGSADDIAQGLQTYSAANNPTAGGEVDGLNVHNNTFTDLGSGTWGYEGIYINSDDGDPTPGGAVTIADNTFSGDIVRAITTERSNVSITGNSIVTDLAPSDLSSGPGGFQGVNVPAAQNITLTGNTINGFWKQVADGGGSLTLADVVSNNTFDKSAYASSGSAIFLSVQDAIDAASASDTVNVGAGTYTEDLVIPEALSSLELVGAGSGSTTIKGVANMPVASWPTVAPNIEVLADGVAIHGFTIQGPDPASGYYSSGMVIGGANVEVYDNVFEVPNAGSADDIAQGLQTYSAANNPTAGGEVDGLNVHNNTFTDLGSGTWGYEGIYINSDDGDPTPGGAVTIADNTFSGDIVRAITTERSNVSITGNSIVTDLAPSDLSSGPGGFQGVNVPAAQNITLTGNTINGFWKQVADGGGSLTLADVVSNNTFDKSAYASSGSAIFSSVQDAIDAASASDTVSVGAGTYDEQLLINTQITLSGTGTSTILRPSATPAAGAYDVEINASNTTIQNMLFDFNGGTGLADGTRSGNGIVVSDLDGPDVTGVTISGNTIYTGDANTGIQTGKNADIGGLKVDGNTFYGDADGSGEGVYVNPLKATATSGVTISGNTFLGNLYSGVSIEASDVLLTGNTINSNGTTGTYGVRFIDLTGGVTFSGVQIGGPNLADANTIQNFTYGIRVGTSTDVGSTLTVTIQGNTLTGNDTGLWARYGADVTATGNSFISTSFGVQNSGTSLVNAEKNWWGDASGPSGLGSGSGAAVTLYVDFFPWCTDAACTTYNSHTVSDYDGDGKTDPVKFDSNTNMMSYLASSTSTWQDVYMGAGTIEYVSRSDFDGDGVTDPAEFIPSTGALWYLEFEHQHLAGGLHGTWELQHRGWL